jgi:hypothetical protein
MAITRDIRGMLVTALVTALLIGTTAARHALHRVGASTCVVCIGDYLCEDGYHDAFDAESDAYWHRNGGAHVGEPYCRAGSCDTKHGPFGCGIEGGPTEAELSDLDADLKGGEVRRAASLMVEYPTHVVFNKPRVAIQLLGCAGSVVRHLSLTSAQGHRLAEILEREAPLMRATSRPR